MAFAVTESQKSITSIILLTSWPQPKTDQRISAAQRRLLRRMANPDYDARIEKARKVLASSIEGESLKKLRLSKGLSQLQLGERIGIPQSHVSKIESGKTGVDSQTLYKLSKALDVDMETVYKLTKQGDI